VATPSLDAVVSSALLAHPGGEARALRLPLRADRPYRVLIQQGEQRLDVAVDPVTLRVIGARSPERSVFVAVRSLHGAFHSGRVGAAVVGLLGVWLVVESLTGLWLYGPSVGTRGRSRSLHRLVGALSLALAVLIGITGALLAIGAALGLLVAGAPGIPSGQGLRRLDAAAARIEAARPGARIMALVAEGDGDTLGVDVRAAGSTAVSTIRLDSRTGAMLEASGRPRSGWDLVRRLHAGEFAGVGSRLVYTLAGLALPLLSITGLVAAVRRRVRPQSSKVFT